jgi:hypothetical protein
MATCKNLFVQNPPPKGGPPGGGGPPVFWGGPLGRVRWSFGWESPTEQARRHLGGGVIKSLRQPVAARGHIYTSIYTYLYISL